MDKLHDAIGRDRQIRFQYYRWNIKKEMELRKEGSWYVVSPWGLMWDDENYYLVAFDAAESKIKHYRVDKMLKISILGERRQGRAEFQAFDLPRYTRSLFGMYGGEETKVTMEAKNEMVGVLIDRFGKDTMLIPDGEEHFVFTVPVAVSPMFLSWVIGFGANAKILFPQSVAEKNKKLCLEALNQYD